MASKFATKWWLYKRSAANLRFLLIGYRNLCLGCCNSKSRTLLLDVKPLNKAAAAAIKGTCRETNIKIDTKQFNTSSSQQGKVLPFKLSDIGEGIAEVTIKEWFVGEGSKVNQFDSICEVQSDKASVTITSKFDGVVKKLYYSIDEIALVGTALVDIEVADGEEAEVDEDGEHLFEDEPVAQQLPKAEAAASSSFPMKNIEENIPVPDSRFNQGKSTLATPAVRRLAMQHDLHLGEIPGSGKDGRVLKEDVLQYLDKSTNAIKMAKVSRVSSTSTSVPTPGTTHPFQSPLKASEASAPDNIEPLTGIKKAMVKAMNSAVKIPHFGYCDEVNADSLIRIRKQLKTECNLHDVKLSFMPFFIKATSLALMKYPVLNSSLNEEQLSLTHKGNHNVGVAMDTADGLIVPNVKDVQNKSLFDIAIELSRLHKLGLVGKLGPADISNGTISLSNIGSISGTYAKPVILPPEVAIAAIGKIQKLPRFDENGNVYAANIFNISWSADHRVIEGAVMARFSDLWKSFIEDPEKMLLHLK